MIWKLKVLLKGECIEVDENGVEQSSVHYTSVYVTSRSNEAHVFIANGYNCTCAIKSFSRSIRLKRRLTGTSDSFVTDVC